MPDYTQLLAERQASIASDARRVAQLRKRFGTWIDKYRGGMPAEWLASIIKFESDGVVDEKGDQRQGEYGLLQIAADVPVKFGLPSSARLDPESNIAIGVLEYSLESALWALRHPGLVRAGTRDAWMLARLSFAVGRYGSYRLADAAGVHTPGDVYGDIARYVAANGGMQLGSQSPEKVRFRTLAIPLQWKVAETAAGGALAPGMPQLIPAPPTGPYKVPTNVASYFVRPAGAFTIILLAAAVAGAYLYVRRRQ